MEKEKRSEEEKEKRSKKAVHAFIDSNGAKCQIKPEEWDEEEEIPLLMWLVYELGPQWTEIATCFKLRTAKACEAMYYKQLRKWKKEKENEDGDDESKENHHSKKEVNDDEDKRQGGGESRVPFQPVNK